MRFLVDGSRQLRIKYDPTPFEAPQCALLPPEQPDDSWATYVR